MMTCRVVTLLTDFGTRDPFVGVMKGAILKRSTRLTIVDLSHAIEPQQVGAGAFWLAQAYPWFPDGTVHVAVVDPGVGTVRRAVVGRAAGHLFVAPDNGLFEVVARRATDFEAREIDTERLGLRPTSRTFHGRDLFAPVGALLASGAVAFDAVGPTCTLAATTHVPEPVLGGKSAEGCVVVVDRFGNLLTNLTPAAFPAGGPQRVSVLGHDLAVVGTFADVPSGALAALIGSFGQLELFVRNGSAARVLGAQRGTPVGVSW
jgi:S-adenosylmethionine hydrolase